MANNVYEILLGDNMKTQAILEPTKWGKFLKYLKDNGIEPSAREVLAFQTHYHILPAHEGGECNWTREQDDSCMFITSCMQSFFLNDGDTPFQNDMDYCCFCGRKINKLPTPPKEGE